MEQYERHMATQLMKTVSSLSGTNLMKSDRGGGTVNGK